MKNLPIPDFSASEVFDASLAGMQDALLHSLISHHKPDLMAASLEMSSAIQAKNFLNVLPDFGVPPSVSSDHLISLYTKGLVGRKAGRKYYDRIKGHQPDGKCAYCLQRPAEQVDHYYPKSRFSKLSVTPANLVPICEKCNTAKLDAVEVDPNRVFIHPYADLVDDYVWLEASLVPDAFGAVRFVMATDENIPDAFKGRIENTFKTLELGRLYAIAASDEISATRYELTQKLQNDGAEGVRRHLKLRRESCEEDDKNSWRSAAYRCWERSDEFIEGGWIRG